MTNHDQDPIQPEPLDPELYAQTLRMFGQLVMPPHGQPITATEADRAWPALWGNEGVDGKEDPVVGNTREFVIHSQNVHAEVSLYLWNSRMSQMNNEAMAPNTDGPDNLPVATLIFDLKDDVEGHANGGMVELSQKPGIYYDFDIDTVIRPEPGTAHEQALLSVMDYLGFDRQFYTAERSTLGNFKNEDLIAFNLGVQRLTDSEGSTINL